MFIIKSFSACLKVFESVFSVYLSRQKLGCALVNTQQRNLNSVSYCFCLKKLLLLFKNGKLQSQILQWNLHRQPTTLTLARFYKGDKSEWACCFVDWPVTWSLSEFCPGPTYLADVDSSQVLHHVWHLLHQGQHLPRQLGGSHVTLATGHHSDLLGLAQGGWDLSGNL